MRFNICRLEAVAKSHRSQQRGAADRDARRRVEQAARGRGRGAVRGVADGDAGRGARDRDREVRGVKPVATRRELEVVHEGVEARAVERSGRGRGEVMVREAEDFILHQLREDYEVAVRRAEVQSVNGEEIGSALQQTQTAGEVDVFGDKHAGVRARDGGGGVVGGRGRRVAAGDFGAVEIRDKAVVILHAERERGERGGVRHVERQAEVDRAVSIQHVRLHVRDDERGEAARTRAGDGQGLHGKSAPSRVADEPEVRVEGSVNARRREKFQFGPTATFVEQEPHRILACSKRESAERVAGTARAGIREGVRADGAGEAVVAVHAEGPRTARRDGDDARGLGDEVFLIHVDGESGEGHVTGEVRAAAGVHVVDRRRVGGEDGGLLRGCNRDAFRRAEIAHANVGANVLHRETGNVVLVTHSVGAAPPGGVVEAESCPGEAEGVVRRHVECDEGFVRGERSHLEVLSDAVGDVWKLLGEQIELGRDGGIRPDQREIFAARAQTERRVQQGTGHAPVLAGGKDGEKAVGRKIRRGEQPAEGRVLHIGERPAVQVHGVGAAVEEFDPVGVGTVLVAQPGRIAGGELGDDDVVCRARGQGRAGKEQRQQEQGDEISSNEV